MERGLELPSGGATGGPLRDAFPSRRFVVCALALLLVVAFGLRVWWALGSPNASRVWDERYSLVNVRPVLLEGSLDPVGTYYPSPVYFLPPALLMMVVRPLLDDPATELIDPETGIFGPWAYLLGRSIQILYGTAAILLIYLLGAMLFDRSVGLLAAMTFAFVPWLVEVSGIFKPDAQVVFFLLLVFLTGARWMRSPSVGAALAVGGAVALATSSKLIAAVAGMAFGVGALVRARERRHYGQILLAGASSVVLFLALTPHLGTVLFGIGRIQDDYAKRADWAGMTNAQIPLRTLRYLLAPTVFGPFLGALALIAYVGLWLAALRAARRRRGEVAGTLLMLAIFPLAYVALYTARSAYFRDNNFTHILPPLVLALAWLVVAAFRAVARRVRIPRPIRAAAVLAAAVAVVPPGFLYVYRMYTPSTRDAAGWYLGAGRPRRMHGRVVIAEPVVARGDDRPEGGLDVPWQRRWSLTAKGTVVVRVSSIGEIPAQRRWWSDGEILRRDLPEGFESAAVDELEIFRPKLGELRGPTVTAVKHFWRRRSVSEPLPARQEPGGVLAFELPDLPRSRFLSIEIAIGRSPDLTPEGSPNVSYASLELPLHRTDLRRQAFSLISERFPKRPRRREVRILGLPPLDSSSFEVYVHGWLPPKLPPEFATRREWLAELEKL